MDGLCEPDDDDNLHLIDTAFENGMNFWKVWKSSCNIEQFLHRDQYISVRGTAVKNDSADQCELQYESDIDGVTIEWVDIGIGMQSTFTHFQLFPSEDKSFRKFYSVIKKHVKLSSYTRNSIDVMKESVGSQIMYHDGWETWLGFIPECREGSKYDHSTQRRLVNEYAKRLRCQFQQELMELLKKGLALRTLSKNNLNDAKKMFVLPGDQRTILVAFQQALNKTELTELPYFNKMLFTFRFGEKCRAPVKLPIANNSGVKAVCIHVGYSISCEYMDLFWNRQGVQELFGDRCMLLPAYSFFECVNAQSNLDEMQSSISVKLRSVCKYPERVQFVQMYSDLPHRYPSTRVHPVSAAVLMLEGLNKANYQTCLYKDALSYLSEIHNNFVQLKGATCRLELVVSTNLNSNEICAADFICPEKMDELLNDHSVLVPFLRSCHTMEHLKEVGLHLHQRLLKFYETKRGTADIRVVWECYQTELAVEKLLWGRPLSNTSRTYAINLGIGVDYPTRSRTDQMGFLSLENSGSCCVDESTIPPIHLYTKSIPLQRQIQKIARIYSLNDGSVMALGGRVVLCLLQDCHETGNSLLRFEQFVMLLKCTAGNAHKHIVGGISVKDLVNMLVDATNTKWPMVFGAVKKHLHARRADVGEILTKGIEKLSIGYFPALRNYDGSRNEGLNWNYRYGFWVLTDISDLAGQVEREAGAIHALILTELENRQLCHTSKLLHDTVFPWIQPVLRKISEKQLTQEEKVKVLTFVSAVALIQNGRYIQFNKLSNLELDLPLRQSMLRLLEVQTKFHLPVVNTVQIYRLHPSIPFKLDAKTGRVEENEAQATRQVPTEQSTEDEHLLERTNAAEESISTAQSVEVAPVRHLPSNKCGGVWRSVELSLVRDAMKLNVNRYDQFTEYQRLCRLAGIPDRSWNSFSCKVSRIRAAESK